MVSRSWIRGLIAEVVYGNALWWSCSTSWDFYQGLWGRDAGISDFGTDDVVHMTLHKVGF